MSEANRLTNHDDIRAWAEARGATPSRVKSTADADGGGVLRFDFGDKEEALGDKEEALEEISWDDFFRIFDDSDLALLAQDETSSGEISRFSKFVQR